MPSTLTPERPLQRLHRGRVRSSSARRALRALLRLTIVLLLAAIGFGGWYLARRGFSRSWRERVVDELHKHGVEASVKRLTLDPFRGLIARDVRIYNYKRREQTLAVVSEISLDINYAALFEHQPFLNAIDIRNGDLTIPLASSAVAHPPHADVKRFRAHIYFPPQRIEVSQAEGFFYGIRVSATGQLIKRDNYRSTPEHPDENAAARLRLLQNIVATLKRFRYPRGVPELQVKFAGDLSDLEAARLEATLHANEVTSGKYDGRDLGLTMEWRDQTLTIPQLEWQDDAGRFSATASWNRPNGRAKFQARSSIAFKRLLGSFGLDAMLADLSFTTPPLIEASGTATIGAAPKQVEVIGRVSLENFGYKSARFDRLTTDFAWERNRFMLRDLHLQQRTGQLSADLLDAPNDFRLNLESTINPTVFGSLASAPVNAFLREWEWQRSPDLRLNVRGKSRDPASWRGTGSIALGPSRFRGVRLNSASGDLRFGDGAFMLENFKVTRDEGVGSGAFGYDSRTRKITIRDVTTTLQPTDAIMWIEPKFFRQVAPYRFHRPPRVITNGIVQLGPGKQTHLQLDVTSPNEMDYTFIDKVLPFDRVSAQLLFTDDRLQIFNLNAALFSGSVTGNADISLGKGDPHYTASIAVANADFPRLTDLYFKYKTSRGLLSGNFDFGGIGDNRAALYGKGSVDVTNGNVFAIPIFGPLSELMSKFFTGAGYSVAHQATAPFTIRDGVIHTDKLKVAGKLFAMLGHGDMNFIKNNLDFDIRIDANGPGALLTPIYQLFEYHGSGTLTKPVWRPKHL